MAGCICHQRQASTRSSLYGIGQVLSEHVDEQGSWWLEICMAQRNIDKLLRETGDDCLVSSPLIA